MAPVAPEVNVHTAAPARRSTAKLWLQPPWLFIMLEVYEHNMWHEVPSGTYSVSSLSQFFDISLSTSQQMNVNFQDSWNQCALPSEFLECRIQNSTPAKYCLGKCLPLCLPAAAAVLSNWACLILLHNYTYTLHFMMNTSDLNWLWMLCLLLWILQIHGRGTPEYTFRQVASCYCNSCKQWRWFYHQVCVCVLLSMCHFYSQNTV